MANSKSKPANLLKHLQTRLSQYVEQGQRVCIALSGGVDSVVLLHATGAIAKALGISQISALHVHHGLSPNADRWESFCKELCTQHCVQFHSQRVDVVIQGDGIEAAARKARYEILENANCDWILLAHHRDDQAETVLLNLLRGAGVYGAAGMNEVRGRLLRPLLDISREQIAEYAQEQALLWVEDESNSDQRYSRSYLRHQIIPLLEQPFPQAPGSLARAGQAFREVAELLSEVAQSDFGDTDHLTIRCLRTLSSLRAANLLAYFLRRQGLQIPSSSMLKEILRQLLTASKESEVCCAIGDREVRRFRDQVWVNIPAQPIAPVSWQGAGTVAWGSQYISIRNVTGGGISVSELKIDALKFSGRRPGSVIQLRENGPHRPLKDVLREASVPPWLRNNLPVLYAEDEIAWVAGIGIAAKYRCKPGAEGFLVEFDGVTW